MKRKVLLLFAVIFLLTTQFVFADEVVTNMDSAKQFYIDGDLEKALKYLKTVREMIEKKLEARNSNTYIELRNWDVVKLSPDKYIGKKVKVLSGFIGISSDGTVNLTTGMDNKYIEAVKDQLGELIQFHKYYFYGEVFNSKIWGPALIIEKIE